MTPSTPHPNWSRDLERRAPTSVTFVLVEERCSDAVRDLAEAVLGRR